MRATRPLVVLLLPAACVIACGGAVAATDPYPAPADEPPSAPPRRPPPARDASRPDVAVDAAAGDCACTEEIPQLEGTCSFRIGPRLIACVAERSPDGGYVTLDLWRSCLQTDAPPSWTPSIAPDQLDLCSCTPGEQHSLCLRYVD
jgi:hypothetical protein